MEKIIGSFAVYLLKLLVSRTSNKLDDKIIAFIELAIQNKDVTEAIKALGEEQKEE